jgi:hypothetical protein
VNAGGKLASPVGEDVNLRALVPSLVKGSMDGLLHVLTVEVNRGLHAETAGKAISANGMWRGQGHLTGNPGHPIRQDTANGSVTCTKRWENNILTTSKIL